MTNLGFDKIYVLGAGAIGSVYGALLSRTNDVTLIGNHAHMDAVNLKGLSIVGDLNETFHLKADNKIRDVPDKTLITLTTKAYDTAKAMKGIKELLKEDTIVLVLQNGLGNEELVKRTVGNRAGIVRGITTVAAEFLEPGEIRFWNGRTIMEQKAAARKVAEAFDASGLETSLSEDFGLELWKKLVVNCVVNPLTALFRVRTIEIFTDSLKTVRRRIVKECIQVAEAEGTILPEDLGERIDTKVSGYTNFSSMYQDIIKGKRTEIDFLNGRIVELGKKHKIATPINETLVCMIRFLEEKDGLSRKDQKKER